MPRLARLDAPGVIHHVMIRGIERRKIFRKNINRNDMMDRLADLLPATNTICYAKGRQKIRAEARGLFCYWAVRELGYGQAELGRRLGMTQPGVGYAVQRGEHIVKENNFLIEK